MIEEGNAPGSDERHVVEGQAIANKVGRRLINAQLNRTAHHLGSQRRLGIRRRRLAHNATTPNNGNRVGNGTDLTQLVRDEHDRGTRVRELTHDRHEFVRFLGCEHRSGLV